MGRLPRPTRVKTRLIPRLGAEGAATLYRAMLLDVLEHAQHAAVAASAELVFAVDTLGEGLGAVDFAPGARLLEQSPGDLGTRLQAAAEATGAEQLVYLGSDSPQLGPERMVAAFEALAQHPAAVIPAVDGGYVLLATRGLLRPLFEQIPWSTDRVLATTLARAQAAGIDLQVLGPPVQDLDEPGELEGVWGALSPTARSAVALSSLLRGTPPPGV